MPSFRYARTIHFRDTDAAGVVFFANYLAIAHEAYEEALADRGLPLSRIFADTGTVIPVAKSECSYLRPLLTGEKIIVDVTPERLTDSRFALNTVIWKTTPREKRAAVIRTEHVCISSRDRTKLPLPEAIRAWIDA